MKKNIESNNSKKIYDSFEKIYLQYGKLVCFKIMEYIKDQSIAEDLMQDVFLSFFNNYEKVKNVKYYLISSARNKAIDYLKNKNNSIVIDEKYIYDNEEISQDIDLTLYDDVLSKMSEVLSTFEIEIVLKHTIDNLSFKSIAKTYNKSINTILTTYYRAIKKVKEKFENE